MPNPLKPNPLSPQRRKQRIDELAARAGSASVGTAVEDRAVSEAGAVDDSAGVSLIASAWRRLRRDPIFLIGAAVTLLFIVLAIFSPLIAPHDPTVGLLLDKVRPQSNPIPGPEAGFPLGADSRGRDMLSRLLVGSRQTLIVGVFATVFGFIGGMTLGIIAGRSAAGSTRS